MESTLNIDEIASQIMDIVNHHPFFNKSQLIADLLELLTPEELVHVLNNLRAGKSVVDHKL